MNVGSLVRGWYLDILQDEETKQVGLVIEVIDHIEAPPVCKILWASGEIGKEWTDDLEVISE